MFATAPLGAVRASDVIIDPELTEKLNTLAAPLRPHLQGTENTRLFVINDDTLNAFATPDDVVYIHSGLIGKTKNEEELRGVIAHELAHVAEKHFLSLDAAGKKATLTTFGGVLAGIGAAMAGAPQAGVALASAGQAAGISGLLQHTRGQEMEADQTARKALLAAGLGTQGMADMFRILQTESQLSYDAPPPYLLTHPMPAGRRLSVQEDNLTEAPQKDLAPTATYLTLKAKVFALTNTPPTTLRTFRDESYPARYARLIATARLGKITEARQEIDALLQENPNDLGLLDFKATLALQGGNAAEALSIWQNLRTAYPKNPVLSFQAAEAARATENLPLAESLYEETLRIWRDWSEAWYSLGLTYGAENKLIQSHLSIAESHYYSGHPEDAKTSLKVAENYFKTTDNKAKNSADIPTWIASLKTRLKLDD
ncbi:MAG: hypothetical protein COY40_03385 [Alphaproteobacteria bacterium CG_4_10_14_0_8_um_filter_53_9]|nr:MAG: hypothetical protein COY40_03385 [Alphaproteobacteria bacterium CG_4_10_14_0_8_um_filter_53_9]